MTGRVYGYARVSSKDQNLERQREALAGVDVLVEEKVSGVADREKLTTLMAFAQRGDTIRVKSIDRLALDTRDLLRIVDELADKGVGLEFIDSPMLNVSTKEGRAMITVFAAFAELEREAIKERQREGIELAKAAGTPRHPSSLPNRSSAPGNWLKPGCQKRGSPGASESLARHSVARSPGKVHTQLP